MDINQTSTKILANIVFSSSPGITMRWWRERFGISMKEMSFMMGHKNMNTLSDYERGRRKNPGILFVKNYVILLVKLRNKKDKDIKDVCMPGSDEKVRRNC